MRPGEQRKKRALKLAAWCLLAALAAGGLLWYSRPVDLYALEPRLTPRYLSVLLLRHTGDAGGVPQRTLELTAEDGAAYETALAGLESLRFRRLPFGSLLQRLRDGQGRRVEPGAFESRMELSDGADSLGLHCRLGRWEAVTYTDRGPRFQAVLLCGGETAGREYNEFLWALAGEDESDS